MKHILSLLKPSAIAIAALVATTACSNDDESDNIMDQDAIRFAPVAHNESRSEPITTNTLSDFHVYAFTDGKLYMENVEVVKNSSNVWTYSPVAHWPQNSVNFYAYAPGEWLTGIQTSLQSVSLTNDGTQDLIYAVTMNQTKGSSAVKLYFHHALARVQTKLLSSNTNLDVNVKNVTLQNIMSKAEFTFPQSTTSENGTSAGTWNNASTPVDYTLYQDATGLSLSTTATLASNSNDGYMLPQDLAELTSTGGTYSGSLIKVECVIRSTATGNVLWPNANTPAQQKLTAADGSVTGLLYYPLSNTAVDLTHWRNDTNYIYVIDIDEAEGLDAIEFDPEVKVYLEQEQQI